MEIKVPAGGSIDRLGQLSHVLAMRGSSDSPQAAAGRGPLECAARRAPCSTGRRCRAGGPPTRTRSRCAVGGVAPRSSPSRQLEAEQPFFGTFRVRSGSGSFYEVEIRSLDGFANSCGCIDHRVNGLGTCKHIEGVLAALRQRGAKAFREAAAQAVRASRFFWTAAARHAGADVARVRSPRGAGGTRLARTLLDPDGTLARDPD